MSRLIVSDHAIVRYLERVGGFEIVDLKRAIAARVRPLLAPGISGVTIDGHTYVIDHRDDGIVVVTVLPRGRTNHGIFSARERRSEG